MMEGVFERNVEEKGEIKEDLKMSVGKTMIRS